MFSTIFAQGIVPENGANTLNDLTGVFVRLISILIPIGGVVLFVMLLIGGFLYMFASGDQRRAEGARNTITYAILGIVVLAAAFFIIQLIANFVGVPAILHFNIYQG